MLKKFITARIASYFGLFLLCALALFILINNAILAPMDRWDSAANALVARNFAFNGIYAYDLPDLPIFWYPAATTGYPVILPVALLYSLFGVSYASTYVIPILFRLLFIILTHIVFLQLTDRICSFVFTALITLVTTFQLDGGGLALIGEIPCVVFILLSVSLLIRTRVQGLKKRSMRMLCIGCGAALSIAMIVKTIAIPFIAVTIVLLLLEITILRRNDRRRSFMYVAIGAAFAFCFLELFRLSQFGWDINNYLQWWKGLRGDILNQTGTTELMQGFTINGFVSSLETLSRSLYYKASPVIMLMKLALPAILYIRYFIIRLQEAGINSRSRKARGKKAKKRAKKPGTISQKNKKAGKGKAIVLSRRFAVDEYALIFGVAASSMLIYAITLGQNTGLGARRLSVYTVLLDIFCLYFLWSICSYCFSAFRDKAKKGERNKKILFRAVAVSVLAAYLISPNIIGLLTIKPDFIKGQGLVWPMRRSTDETVSHINNLPKDSVFYVYAKDWADYAVVLFSGIRPAKMIYEHTMSDIYSLDIYENTYLLANMRTDGTWDYFYEWLGTLFDYEIYRQVPFSISSNPNTPTNMWYAIIKINSYKSA